MTPITATRFLMSGIIQNKPVESERANSPLVSTVSRTCIAASRQAWGLF